jgi:DNA-binding transcriptional LysR family regulator
MKQVCVKPDTWVATASTTRGALLPTVVTAMPDPRSINLLPSRSSTMPPSARVAKTGMVVLTPRLTAASFRAISSRERGPGRSVARYRVCGNGVWVMDPQCDAGSANRARDVLHVTQPVLSRQLRQLEAQTNLRLFEREGRRLCLTHVGEEFLARARRLLRDADLLEDAAKSLASGQVRHLRIAVPTTTLTDVLAPFLATFGPNDPVPLLRSLDPCGAAAAIAAGADLAIVHRPPPKVLAARPLAVLPILAYIRRDDPWAGRGDICLAQLVERPLVLMTDDFRPRTLLDSAIDEAGLAYGDVLECTNAQLAQAMAAAGRGVAVVERYGTAVSPSQAG